LRLTPENSSQQTNVLNNENNFGGYIGYDINKITYQNGEEVMATAGLLNAQLPVPDYLQLDSM
jgi:hypothetical protein